jgi:hypothetical protein
METTADGLKQEIFIPIKVVKRGSAKAKIIAPEDVVWQLSLNHPLIRALVKAYKWEQEIAKLGNIDLYCRKNKLSKRYLQRILRLNNLCPKIKKAIMDGKFPQNILLQDLIYKDPDLLWSAQEEQLLKALN